MLMERVSSLVEGATRYKAQYDVACSLVNDVQVRKDELQKLLGIKYKERDTYQTSMDVLKSLIERLSEEHLKHITQLLSYALQVIFVDRQYTVELSVSESRNVNSAALYLVETFDDGSEPLRSPLEDGTGGSIRTVLGFVLQIFYLRYLGLAPIMFIDEAFTSLSFKYIPSLVAFMRVLSEQKGFIFVMVSHDTRIISEADTAYQVGKGTLKLLSPEEIQTYAESGVVS